MREDTLSVSLDLHSNYYSKNNSLSEFPSPKFPGWQSLVLVVQKNNLEDKYITNSIHSILFPPFFCYKSGFA